MVDGPVATRRAPVRLIAASVVATIAFWAYTQTLLPGVDMGDTGGLQAAVLWPETSARQAYPLYFRLARPFVRATSVAGPARSLNLFSAVWGAVAVGLLAYVCATVMASVAAGVVAGLLLAFSYTYWTQAILAEVYTLNLALIGFCLMTLLAYERRPSLPRLAIVFAVYAAAFGNHLSMILCLVPFALFLALVTPEPRLLLRPRVVALAAGLAFAGALQYLPNLAATWQAPDAPAAWTERVAAFWFDVTKADWRESMILGVRSDQIGDRLGMWWFDSRQQFGVAGLALAAIGAARLWDTSRRWAVLLVATFAIETTFALTYNVGDSHVFFLPGHFIAAFLAGCAVARLRPSAERGERTAAPSRRRLALSTGLAAAAIALAVWRAWDTWPAVDRHDDQRGEAVAGHLALGLSERRDVLLSNLNWQFENVLLYEGRYRRTGLLWTRLAEVLPHFPFLVDDNHAIGRDIVLTEKAAADVVAAFGSRYLPVEDSVAPVPALAEVAERVPRGAPYVLALLTPPRDERFDATEFAAAASTLTGDHAPPASLRAYQVIAGIAGEKPAYVRADDRPFRDAFALIDETITVRMESWLPSDTFRRAGFGHVLRGRQRMLILERGVNLTWLGQDGSPAPPFYTASLFALQRRFRLAASAPRLAAGDPLNHSPATQALRRLQASEP